MKNRILNFFFILLVFILSFHCNLFSEELNDYNPYDYEIPDAGDKVLSDLGLSGAPETAKITNVKVYLEIFHDSPSDLDVWITFDDGGWHDYFLYHQGDRRSKENIAETIDNIDAWNGFSPNQTYYLCAKDRVTGNTGYISFFELWIEYEENECPDPPRDLSPVDNATNVSVDVKLDWSCSDPDGDMLYYTVYFEKNDSSPDNKIKEDEAGSKVDPGKLEYGETYYWYVVAYDHYGCAISSSHVYQFETENEESQNAEIISFVPPIGSWEREAQTSATVTIKNTGTVENSFWVGLSFAEDWVDLEATPGSWPDGWYDIRPQETEELEPRETGVITFDFSIPPTLPSGVYTSRAAIWSGYNSSIHKMLEPRFDKSDKTSFELDSYPEKINPLTAQLLKLASYIIFDETLLGDMSSRYFENNNGYRQKLLFYIGITGHGTLFKVPVSGGGTLLIDLADLFDISYEGKDEGWVTIWIDTKAGVQLTAADYPIEVDMGLISHDFEYGELALADYRRKIIVDISGQVGVIVFSGLGWNDGLQFPEIKVVSDFSIACEATGTLQELVSLEINKEYFLAALNQASGESLTSLSKSIIDYLITNEDNDFIRDKTDDDGNFWIENEQGDWSSNLKCSKTGYPTYFYTEVADSNSELNIITNDGTGDVDLFVKYGERPTLTNYDYNSTNSNSNYEDVLIENANLGKYYIMLYASSTYSGVNLSAKVTTHSVEEDSNATDDNDSTLVKVDENDLYPTFTLCQNYPNPFNSMTNIEYSLPENTFVDIKIYDLLGKEIVTLVMENKQSGFYSIQFNAAKFNLASGIYFYRLIAGENVETKRMVYLK